MKNNDSTADQQNQKMRQYYQWQSKIYDSTRWTFLFGRNKIIQLIPSLLQEDVQILEIGCGTGVNLEKLANKFKTARLHGLDVSGDMIRLAQKNLEAFKDRVSLYEKPYQLGDTTFNGQMDVILFSYSLTMINPQWNDLLLQAKQDLKPGGVIAVVDFYNSRFNWFKQHMGNNHVRMDGHLLPVLEAGFDTFYKEIKSAYGGVWEYFLYVGKKF